MNMSLQKWIRNKTKNKLDENFCNFVSQIPPWIYFKWTPSYHKQAMKNILMIREVSRSA